MRFLVIADPVSRLKPKSDTSIAMAEALLAGGHRVDFTTMEGMNWLDSKVSFRVKRASSRGGGLDMGTEEVARITKYQSVLIRKDPPFDQSYVKLLWLLAAFESKLHFSNRPSDLLRHHEKLLPIQGVEAGYLKPGDLLPTCCPGSFEDALEFARSMVTEQIVMKPFYGFGGGDILRFARKKFEKEARRYFGRGQHWILQPFHKDVLSLGDCRIFFIFGKFMGGFARIPSKGGFVSNLAQGGTASLRKFSASEVAVIRRLEKWIQSLELDFAGADLIGTKINEVNITSPTGIRSYQSLTGVNLAENYREGLIKRCQR